MQGGVAHPPSTAPAPCPDPNPNPNPNPDPDPNSKPNPSPSPNPTPTPNKARPPGLHGHASHQKREHASRLGKMYSEPRPLSPPHLAPISPQSSFIGVPQNAIEERAHHDVSMLIQ